MRKIRIIEHISLDGVIQAPGGPGEDGDYPYGGWTVPHADPAVGEVIVAAHRNVDGCQIAQLPAFLPQASTLSTKSICTCDIRCAILHHAQRRAANMPRFYFHLSAPDQDFPDNIGSEGSDLATAHFIAVRLMKRVMMISSFADCAPDLRRWTVKVADERGRQLSP